MTPEAFYKQVAASEAATRIHFNANLELVVGPADQWAAKLILWLHEQLPTETTQGELEDVLDAAKWWVGFWAAMHFAEVSE